MIVGVAYKDTKTGLIYTMPKPNRHDAVIMAMMEQGIDANETDGTHEAGFITDEGIFLNRRDGWLHASEIGQGNTGDDSMRIATEDDKWLGFKVGEEIPSVLVSEDLW